MNDTRLYLIQLDGLVNEEMINPSSPIKAFVVQVDTFTQCTVRTDQSGLIGVLRHLHSRGLVLLSVTIISEKSGESNVP